MSLFGKLCEGSNPDQKQDKFRTLTIEECEAVCDLANALADVVVDPDRGPMHVAAVVRATIALKAVTTGSEFYDLTIRRLKSKAGE